MLLQKILVQRQIDKYMINKTDHKSFFRHFKLFLLCGNQYMLAYNNSSIIIRHLDIQHGNTCAELEFPSPISSVIKRCQICKSASTAVSKKVICYIQIVYEKRSLNVSKRSGQLSFPT
ncbi:Ribosomal RNA small subunit methyltransferase [Trichinella spiralis]